MAKKLGFILSFLHFVLFAIVFIIIHNSIDGQRDLIWVLFVFIDLPIALIYYITIGWWLLPWLGSTESPVIREILFPPYILFGLIGTIWWYYLPRLFMPKKWGGIWGNPLPKEKVSDLYNDTFL